MPEGKATKSKSTFRQECAVEIDIRAPPQKVWKLLTDAEGFPRWNPTVTRIEGRIAKGERLKIQVPLAPGRTFKPRVAELEPDTRMVWRDGAAPFFQGVRTFTLTPKPGGVTGFSMVEVFSGLTLPMAAGSLPDFAPAFEEYAAALKKAAEGGA